MPLPWDTVSRMVQTNGSQAGTLRQALPLRPGCALTVPTEPPEPSRHTHVWEVRVASLRQTPALCRRRQRVSHILVLRYDEEIAMSRSSESVSPPWEPSLS